MLDSGRVLITARPFEQSRKRLIQASTSGAFAVFFIVTLLSLNYSTISETTELCVTPPLVAVMVIE